MILILAANTHFLNTQGVVHILQFVRVCLMLPAFFPPPREKYQPTTITLKLLLRQRNTHQLHEVLMTVYQKTMSAVKIKYSTSLDRFRV